MKSKISFSHFKPMSINDLKKTLMLAMEVGYKAHEKGESLQQAQELINLCFELDTTIKKARKRVSG